MQTANPERRRDPRVRQALPLTLGAVSGTTRDMSVSGLLFETDTPLAVGCEIRLTIDMVTSAGEKSLRCRGEVLRVKPRSGRMGVAVRILESVLEDR